jgi:hypothetical protein
VGDDEETDEIYAVNDGPDLDDLEMVILNVQTRDGRQFSWMMPRGENYRLALRHDHEGEYEEIIGDEGKIVDTRFIGRQAWEFVILRD